MPDTTSTSHQPPEDRFLAWVDAFVNPATAIPVPDPDLADIAGTAAFVQRTAGIGGATSLPTDRTESMWEEIMQTTTMTPETYPTLPRSDVAPPSGSPRSVSLPATGWRSYLATAVLITAIVAVSAYTVWRIAGPLDWGDADERQPGVAGPATPATESPDGCPLISDMLVFVGEVPNSVETLGLTYALVEPDSDFVIACPGIEHPEPLRTGVSDAAVLPWPGTVMLELVGGDAIAYNVGTGEEIALGPDGARGATWWGDDVSPWLLTPANAAYTDWRITNLKTMATMTLSDEIGGVLPEAITPQIVSSPGAPHAIFMEGSGWYGTAPEISSQGGEDVAELPGGALVVDETLETRRWVDTWGQVAVSDDAIAYQTQKGTDPMIRVDDAKSGEPELDLIGINFNGPPGQRFALAGDGKTFVYLDEGQVWLVAYRKENSTDSPISPVDIDDRRAIAVYPTGVPGRVLVEWISDENIGGADISGAKEVSILDVASEELTDVPGLLPITFPASSAGTASFDSLLTMESASDSSSRSVIRMIDIATGEVAATSEPVAITVEEAVRGNWVFGASESGALATVNQPGGGAVLLDATTGTVATISTATLPASGEQVDIRWSVMPSHDGAFLYATGLPQPDETGGLDIAAPSDPMRLASFAIAPMSADPQWSEPLGIVPAGVIHGIPTSDDDELAVLEAQEFASPVAIPATPVATTLACGLTQDVPVFVGTVPEADFIETFVLLDDQGTLTLNCDDASETTASGVVQVVPTEWSGAIAIAKDNETVQLMDITSGATVDLESEVLLDESGLTFDDSRRIVTAKHSPWLITLANDHFTDWRFTDLRTMESFLLSDEIGGVLSEPLRPWLGNRGEDAFDGASTSQVGVVTFVDASLIAMSSAPTTVATADVGTATLPTDNAALVLPESIDDRRWIEISPTATRIIESVSADGSLLAYLAPSESDAAVIRVEHAVDGEFVADITIELEGGDLNFLVSSNPALLVYTDGHSIEIVGLESGAEPKIVESEILPSAVYWLTATTDPYLVLVSDGTTATILDITTSEVVRTYTNVPYAATQTQHVDGSSRISSIVRFIAKPDSGDSTTVQLVDPVNGNVLVESSPVEFQSGNLEPNRFVSLARNGPLAVVPLGQDRAMVLDAESGASWDVSVPDSEVMEWVLSPSHDGQFIYAISSRSLFDPNGGHPFYLAEAVPGAEWVKVDAPSIPRYIVGTHGISGDDENAFATPTAQESPSPPVATPAAVASAPACDLSGDFPVFTDVEEPPIDGTVLILDEGELWLRCGDTGSALVEKGVATVVPGTTWPGAVLMEMDDGSLHGVNVLTGARSDLGVFHDQVLQYTAFVRVTRWMFIPTTPEMVDWRIVDLEMMDSVLLSDDLGGVLPGPTVAHLWATTHEAAVIGFGGTPVIAGRPMTDPPDRGGATPSHGTPTVDLSSEWSALVIDGSLDNRRWIETSPALRTTAAISPDGELLAYSLPAGDGFTVRVERLSDGELVADTGIEYGGGDTMILLNGTAGLVRLAPDRIDRVTWPSFGTVLVQTMSPFDSPLEMPVLIQTTDPDIVIVGATGPSGESAGYLVDAASGEVSELPGMLQAPFDGFQYDDGLPVGYVMATVPSGTSQSIVQMSDVTNGQTVVTSKPLDVAPDELAMQPAALRDGGSLGMVFLPDGRTVVLDADAGETIVIEPPVDARPSYLMPSPDGRSLVAWFNSGRVFIGEVTPDADWIEMPSDSQFWFLPGAGALPETVE